MSETTVPAATIALPDPLLSTRVQHDWIDYNGHMNDAYYAVVFSQTIDRVMVAIGMDAQERTRNSLTIYTMTMTIHYLRECLEGEALTTRGRILEYDTRRIRLWVEMIRASGEVAAQSEQVLLCVDQSGDKPRAAPFAPDHYAAIVAFHKAQAHLPMPKEAGRGISLSRPK